MYRSAVLALFVALYAAQAADHAFPDPAVDEKKAEVKTKKSAVLAGGCFWCTEAVFEQIAGVDKVISGYSGGDKKSAHYEVVSSGRTEHAESIQVFYDASKITFGTILKVFFSAAHDPTTLNYQGPDHGTQYRSAIFYMDEEQKKIAEAYIKQLNEAGVFKKPIVTQLAQFKAFYDAEEYHQDFVKRNPEHPYVRVNAVPKIEKTRKYFAGMLKKW